MISAQSFNFILTLAIPMLFAITIHEYAHGLVADKLGDKTARMLGRLSLNPINHIDPFGTILLPLAIALSSGGSMFFGYAKPVPISIHNFKNLKRDIILVTLAGPMSNFIMGFLWLLSNSLCKHYVSDPALYHTLSSISTMGVKINIVLGVLNILPIPPLDGSKVLSILMPRTLQGYIFKYEQYGIFLIALLAFSGMLGQIIRPLFMHVLNFYFYITNLWG